MLPSKVKRFGEAFTDLLISELVPYPTKKPLPSQLLTLSMANNGEAASTYVSHFQTTIDSVPSPISEVLATYSGIPKDAQIQHIIKLRDEAYAKCPYPCIGNLRFLNLDLSAHPAYAEHVLAPLKQPVQDGEVEPLFLDVGTCFGQDVRKLIYDGAPVERLWASDVERHLIDLGFDLFNDKDKLPESRFLCPGDLLANAPEDRLNALDDRVTILHLYAVFHLFTFEDQRKAVDRSLRLLRKDTGLPVLVVGGQVGSATPGHFSRQNLTQDFSHLYRHNVESWKELWEDVAGGAEWKDRIKRLEVKSELQEPNVGQTGQVPIINQGVTGGRGQALRHLFEVWVTFN